MEAGPPYVEHFRGPLPASPHICHLSVFLLIHYVVPFLRILLLYYIMP